MPRLAALGLAALALTLALSAPSPAAAVENRCGRNAHCDLAKRSCTIDGWTCRRHFFGNSGTRVRCTSQCEARESVPVPDDWRSRSKWCTSGNRRVRWFYGA